jgi:hypothetical protein
MKAISTSLPKHTTLSANQAKAKKAASEEAGESQTEKLAEVAKVASSKAQKKTAIAPGISQSRAPSKGVNKLV